MLHTYPSFPSRYVPPRTVHVYLPRLYSTHTNQSFPVIYLHDGQNLFDPATSFSGVDWAVHEALEKLVQHGRAQPAILVGICNTPQRRAEYFPQKAFALLINDALRAHIISNYGSPCGDRYLQFIVTELKPFIDSSYRTLPDPAHTAIMGSSMGGLISLYALCEYPLVFGSAACLSTHWPAGDGVMIHYLQSALPKPHSHRLYFDHGTETLDASYDLFQRQVDNLLRTRGYLEGKNWITRRFPGHEHSERAWRSRVHIPLEFLLHP
ncbi:MAG: esterase family protein [bacterium]|nr:esterase family protein [bacterium]